MATKYGGRENLEQHVIKGMTKAEKALSGLPEEGMHSTLISMHQSSHEAEKRRTRESGRGTGFSVHPVSNQLEEPPAPAPTSSEVPPGHMQLKSGKIVRIARE